MQSLFLAAIFFFGLRLGIAGTSIRDLVVAAVGLKAYRALFSIASLARRALCFSRILHVLKRLATSRALPLETI
jgi:uncharacterized membrane protein